MGKLKRLLRDIFLPVIGSRNITFYFSTLSLSDSLLALSYSACALLRLPVAHQGRERLSKKVSTVFGQRQIFFYGSARSALCNHLKCLGFERDLEVILTGFTCDVVPNAVIQAGLKPIYADIQPESFCMSVESVREKISAKSRVLIIQHTFGIPADLDALLALAREYDLYVIEDCAVSLGSAYKERLTGTFGDAAIFSFELSKVITSCRGGMLFVNSDKLQGIRKHKEHYRSVPEQSTLFSGNILFQTGLSGILYRPLLYNIGKYIAFIMFKLGFFKYSSSCLEEKAQMPENYTVRLSDEQAIILLRQMEGLDTKVNNSRRIASWYYEHLSGLSDVVPYEYAEDRMINFIRYPVLVSNRNMLIEEFNKNGIELGLWFTAPLSSPSIDHALFGYTRGECPHAEKVADNICNLPTHIRLEEKDLEKIGMIFRKLNDSMYGTTLAGAVN